MHCLKSQSVPKVVTALTVNMTLLIRTLKDGGPLYVQQHYKRPYWFQLHDSLILFICENSKNGDLIPAAIALIDSVCTISGLLCCQLLSPLLQW